MDKDTDFLRQEELSEFKGHASYGEERVSWSLRFAETDSIKRKNFLETRIHINIARILKALLHEEGYKYETFWCPDAKEGEVGELRLWGDKIGDLLVLPCPPDYGPENIFKQSWLFLSAAEVLLDIEGDKTQERERKEAARVMLESHSTTGSPNVSEEG